METNYINYLSSLIRIKAMWLSCCWNSHECTNRLMELMSICVELHSTLKKYRSVGA